MRFDRAINIVLKHEGGLSDDPADLGGITHYGISLRAYPELGAGGIRDLTKAQAIEIYRRDYWQPIRGDDLPWPAAMVTLDAAVNSGVRKASRWLQMVVETTIDDHIGDKTIAAAFECDQSQLCRAYTDLRLSFLRTLHGWDRFKGGWEARCLDALKEALS